MMLRAIVLSAVVAVVVALLAASSPEGQTRKANSEGKGDVQRGKYLVEEVAKCPECHTPRDDQGQLKSAAWLRGAPIWIRPVAHIQNWADSAPSLAGLPGMTDAQAETVLEKGTGPESETLRPPMHTYHMTREDARAIIAYLKSLPEGPAER
jgi:mono/diheme cytochrome c family protein